MPSVWRLRLTTTSRRPVRAASSEMTAVLPVPVSEARRGEFPAAKARERRSSSRREGGVERQPPDWYQRRWRHWAMRATPPPAAAAAATGSDGPGSGGSRRGCGAHERDGGAVNPQGYPLPPTPPRCGGRSEPHLGRECLIKAAAHILRRPPSGGRRGERRPPHPRVRLGVSENIGRVGQPRLG